MLLLRFSLTVPTGPPQGVEVRSENSTTLVLSWQPPAPENQNGIIVHYIVNITEMETGRLLSFTAVNTTTLSVTMLHPFYTYTCIVAAVTVGIGPYSTTVEVELPEDGKQVCSGLIYVPFFFHSTIQFSSIMLTFSNITDSRFSLVWQDPPPEDQNGIICFYSINISYRGGDWETVSAYIFSSSHSCGVSPSILHLRVYCCCINCHYWSLFPTSHCDNT